jgi:SAM-dependent methyltransferase
MVDENRVLNSALVKEITGLSARISYAAPAMKPFIRFGRSTDNQFYSKRFWDFDDELQKRLLSLLFHLILPDEIVALGIEQWHINMERLIRTRAYAIQVHTAKGTIYRDFGRADHLEYFTQWMQPGSSLLFVGAGTGPACLWLAERGYRVVGFDPVLAACVVAQQWAQHVGLSVDYMCMDMMRLALRPETFDHFVLGLYSSLPATPQLQTLLLQMARSLKPGGIGFISAIRKKYLSHWYLMGSDFPPAMIDWLRPQSELDFYFTSTEGTEERLSYGLYMRTQSVESLVAELEPFFEVIDCRYDVGDPRYLSAAVRVRSDVEMADSVLPAPALPLYETEQLASIERSLVIFEQICEELERHLALVKEHFQRKDAPDQLFAELTPNLARFVTLLNMLLPEG